MSDSEAERYELTAPSWWGGWLRNVVYAGSATALGVLLTGAWDWQPAQLRVAAIVGLIGAAFMALRGVTAMAVGGRSFELHPEHMLLPPERPWKSSVRVAYARLRAVSAARECVLVEAAARTYRYSGRVQLEALAAACSGKLALTGPAPLRVDFERRSQVAQRALERRAPATWTLISLLAVCYLLQTLCGSSTELATLLRAGAGSRTLIEHGQLFRLITATLVHAGPVHLINNLIALWLAGRHVEPVIGSARMLLVFMVSALICSLVTLALPFECFVGASGGVFGVIAARGVQELVWRRDLPLNLRSSLRPGDGNPVYIDAFFGLAGALWNPQMNWLGHLGGMLGGAACAYAMLRGRALLDIMRPSRAALRRAAFGMCAIFIAGLGTAAAHAAHEQDADMLLLARSHRAGRESRERLGAAIVFSHSEHASDEELQWAHATLARAPTDAMPSAEQDERRWALALLNVRLGHAREAMEDIAAVFERQIDAPQQVIAALALALASNRERHGVLRLDRNASQPLGFEVVSSNRLAISLETAQSVELLAIASRRGQPIGLLRIWVAAEAPGRYEIESGPASPEAWPADAHIELALVYANRNSAYGHGAAVKFRYRPLGGKRTAWPLSARRSR